MYGGPGDAVSPGDLTQALAALPIRKNRLAIQFQRPASDVAPFEPGAPHAGFHSFDDQASFQLRNHRDDSDNSAAQRAAGVKVLSERNELDVQPAQFVECRQEVLDTPGEPVRRPYQDDIELAATGVAHQIIEPGPARLGAGDLVAILGNDLESTLDSHLPQVKQLRLNVLAAGADSRVEGDALHWRRPFFDACLVT